MKRQKLSEAQKERLGRLRLMLRTALDLRNYKKVQAVIADIQGILAPKGLDTMLLGYKNSLFEAAIEAEDYKFAIRGLGRTIESTSSRTKVRLQAEALLAICHIRMGNLKMAEPLMESVLKNDKVIKSLNVRARFKAEVIARFQEEAVCAALRDSAPRDRPKSDDVETDAGELLRCNVSEDELHARIGSAAPPNAKTVILQIDDFSRRRIDTGTVKLLPSPEQQKTDKQVGVTVFQALKRRLYAALCDAESDIYKAWAQRGLFGLLGAGGVASVVNGVLLDLNAAAKTLVVPLVALVMKLGIEAYCSVYKPKDFISST